MSNKWLVTIPLACVFTPPFEASEKSEFAKPVKVEAAGKALDIRGFGHSAPYYGDFNGDGVNDLLVGEFTDGGCRIYINEGTNAEPKFAEFTYLMAGGKRAKVPTG